MATGDKAAAKGWDVVPDTRAHSLGANDINYSRDLVADEVDARVAADALKMDASKIVISTTAPPVVNGQIWIKPL